MPALKRIVGKTRRGEFDRPLSRAPFEGAAASSAMPDTTLTLGKQLPAVAEHGRAAWQAASGPVRLRVAPHPWDRSSPAVGAGREMRFICANRISTFFRSRHDCWKASVLA